MTAAANSISRQLTRKQLILLCLAYAFALGGSVYGYYWWAVDRFFQSPDDAYVGGDLTPISPHIAGFVADVAVKDNELVHAGQLLVHLDDRDVRAAANHAAPGTIVTCGTGFNRCTQTERLSSCSRDKSGLTARPDPTSGSLRTKLRP